MFVEGMQAIVQTIQLRRIIVSIRAMVCEAIFLQVHLA